MQLTERIHLVGSGRHGFGLTHPSDCHVYLVDGGTEAALIDAGAGLGRDAVLTRLDGTGVSRDRVRRLFLTHAHADHAGGAAGLRAALRLEVHASPEVATILRTGDEAAASVTVGKAQGSYAPDYVYEATPVDGELHDGGRIRVGDLEVEAIATPGHAAGHVAYLVHGAGRADLFTGDTLLFGGVIILQDTWDCDVRAHVASLRRLATHPHDGCFPGHLTFSVTEGDRHVRAAIAALDRGALPPNLL
ncbi:MAG: MBL fold metallo-hydrolase [Chloroflexota bacterium]|jgi:glyoxylase-like metal-dependent hydrolase (beta-lactamase superfamily II)